ncbi:hypothetical protein I6E74_09925 [Salinibacterium sp. SWN139]|uniref:hypothetical protein n=1 Tax=Salinibacterium sp. SWN139 TaxID=2792055 RepID=UPI0018CF2F2D|nr:hypothetical protein [Salinibacterium sp. SWN139]MBH0054482.1 hypothetical protein [Salinibacterium sp. SWN139]
MSDKSIREQLADAITPLLPSTWKIVPNQVGVETLSKVTVVIKHLQMSKFPEAPIGHLQHELTITIIDPHTDQVRAENALDDSVLELVTALDSIPGLIIKLAKKVFTDETYLGWDVEITTFSRKEK